MSISPLTSLSGASAVVTGAAQGLGYAIAKAYVNAGMRVSLIDVNAEVLQSVVDELRGLGGECTGITANLADIGETKLAITKALDLYGTPRVLIHNAAILKLRPFEALDFDLWQLTVNVGIQAAYLLTNAVWGKMIEAGVGSIVYVSSRSGVEGFAQEAAYCTAKHGLEGLMKSLALEGKAHNIAVNTITPGMFMHTPMSEQNYDESSKSKWVDPYLLTPAFIALAAQDASGLTGQRLSAWDLSQELKQS